MINKKFSFPKEYKKYIVFKDGSKIEIDDTVFQVISYEINRYNSYLYTNSLISPISCGLSLNVLKFNSFIIKIIDDTMYLTEKPYNNKAFSHLMTSKTFKLKDKEVCDLYRVEIQTPKKGTLYIFLDKTLEEVEALKFGFKNETDLKLIISKQKR